MSSDISLASSFMLCAVELVTTPVAETLCPTWSASATVSLRTSQVPPSLPINRNSFAEPVFSRHPVIVRVASLSFESVLASVHDDAINRRTKHSTGFLVSFLLQICCNQSFDGMM